MAQPIIVTLPHRLGKAEALRRLQASFSNAQSSGAGLFVFKNQWSGDHLDFRAKSSWAEHERDRGRCGGSCQA
jgi:hypothetical protein